MRLIFLIFVASRLVAYSLEFDYLDPFEKLFQAKKISSLLEFGLSEASGHFLDHCDQVTSIQMVAERNRVAVEESYQKWSDHFRDNPRFYSQLYYCSRQIADAEAFAEATGLNPLFHDAGYLFEVKELCDTLFRERVYDVAFVDPAILIRGDLINELFGRVDIIVAHDTNFHPSIYGWDWLHTPIEYQKLNFPNGSGTTFWIKKTERELIECLESSS